VRHLQYNRISAVAAVQQSRILDLRCRQVDTKNYRHLIREIRVIRGLISPMAIAVVCPSCHARFQVSEKFAGKEGPCPKCKQKISVPALADEVKIHGPEEYEGAKDAKGRSVLKPIARVEAKVQPAMVAGVIGAIVLCFIVAFVLRGVKEKDSFAILGLGAVILAPPLVYGGYSFLRNQELEPYRGMAVIVRVAICSAVYAALWGAIWALKHFLIGDASPEIWQYFIVFGPPLGIGALAALATLDLDFGSGIFHYVLYLATCVLLRLAMKLPLV
jgi:hypothetical protein